MAHPTDRPEMAAKYRLSVCPHDTAKNFAGWFLLNTYLQRRLGISMHFEPSENFNAEREAVLAGGADFVYANPFSAYRFYRERGFVPVAKPIEINDETLLVARADSRLDPSQRLTIASATDKLIVHFLGLTLVDQIGWPVRNMQYEFVGNHLKVVQAVVNAKADAGFVFNETWAGLSPSTREALQVLAQSHSRRAWHCFCVAPELAHRLDDIRQVLCAMQDDPAGKRVLEDLKFRGFEPLEPHALEGLAALVQHEPEAEAAG